MAETWNITLERGYGWSADLYVTDPITGAAVNITGWHARHEIKTAYGTTAVLTHRDTDTAPARITINGPLGKVSFALTTAEITALAGNQYVHNVALTDAASIETRRATGLVTMEQT